MLMRCTGGHSGDRRQEGGTPWWMSGEAHRGLHLGKLWDTASIGLSRRDDDSSTSWAEVRDRAALGPPIPSRSLGDPGTRPGARGCAAQGSA